MLRSSAFELLLALPLVGSAAHADDTKLVSTLDGTTPLGGRPIDMTPDGRYVLFASYSSEYVPDDTNQQEDLFVRDLEAGTVERVNLADDESESWVGFHNYSVSGSISADGRYVAFETEATLDASDNAGQDVYLRDRVDGTTTLVSHSPANVGSFRNSFYPRVAADGSCVVFTSSVPNLVDGDENHGWDVFEWDRATNVNQLVTTDATGAQIKKPYYGAPFVSSDGTIVVFQCWTNVRQRIVNTFVKDLVTGALDQIDGYADGSGFAHYSQPVDMTPDGRFVLLFTDDPLVADDKNGKRDGYVYDRQTSSIERATFGAGFLELASEQLPTAMSDDARRIAFISSADASGDDVNGVNDGFVFDRDTGAALRVTVGPNDESGHSGTGATSLSADGRSALFVPGSSLWPGGLAPGNVVMRKISDVPAAWSNFGDGFDGRFGTPQLTLDARPCRSTTVGLHVGNSSGLFSASVLFVGFASASLPTSLGGTLLVAPITNLLLPLPPSGDSFPFVIPTAGNLPGLHVYLQDLQIDPWAVKGVSFTPGLDLTIGD